MPRRFLICASLILICRHASAQKPSFEVATIKRSVSQQTGGTLAPGGGRFTTINVPLNTVLVYAYSPADAFLVKAQIIGGPEWMYTDRYDIQAKASDDIKTRTIAEAKAMVQSLLEERFQLKAHREVRELPVYNLVPAKNGPILAKDQTPPDPLQSRLEFRSEGVPLSTLPRGAMRMITGSSGTTLMGNGITISRLVEFLQNQSDRMIIDKSGVHELMDIQIKFSQDAGPSDSAPLLFTAIQDLGLKLESAKAPVDVLVIDSVQKPSEN